MKTTKEISSLDNFEGWGGAQDNIQALTLGDRNELAQVLEDIYPEGLDETTLNDILRFDFNWCAHSLGYRNEMAVFNGNDRDNYAEHYEKILSEKFPAYADYVADYVADYLDDLTDEDENEDRSEDRDGEAEDSFYYYLKDNPEMAGAAFADIISDREGGDEAQAWLLLNQFSDDEKGEKEK